jgi:phospholipid N-methyltransferase
MALAVNYSRWIFDRLRPFIGKHIVEVGAGIGSFTKILLETQPESMTLLEPSVKLYPLLVKRLPALDARGITEARAATLIQAFCETNSPRQPDTAIYVNVLEHIADDENELRVLHTILPVAGRLLIFVPANPWLMGTMDHHLRHFRRYKLDELVMKCKSAGFRIHLAEYFDVIGIIPWWFNYCLLKSDRMDAASVQLYDRFVVPISRAFERLITPPIGKSVLLVAERA